MSGICCKEIVQVEQRVNYLEKDIVKRLDSIDKKINEENEKYHAYSKLVAVMSTEFTSNFNNLSEKMDEIKGNKKTIWGMRQEFFTKLVLAFVTAILVLITGIATFWATTGYMQKQNIQNVQQIKKP